MPPPALIAPDDPTLDLTADPAALARPGLLRLARQWLPERDDSELQDLVDDALTQALDGAPPHALHATVSAALRDAALGRTGETPLARRPARAVAASPRVTPARRVPVPPPVHPRQVAAARGAEVVREAAAGLADRLPSVDGRTLRRAGAAAAIVAAAGFGASALFGGDDGAQPVAPPPLRSVVHHEAFGNPSEALLASHLAKERAARELVQLRAAELLRAERRDHARERARRLAHKRAERARERRRAAARRERRRSTAAPATSTTPPAITPFPPPASTPPPTSPPPQTGGGGNGGGGGGWQFEFSP